MRAVIDVAASFADLVGIGAATIVTAESDATSPNFAKKVITAYLQSELLVGRS